MTAPPASPPAAKPSTTQASTKAGTDYVILSRLDEAGRIIYIHEKTLNARDTETAIEKYAEGNGNKPGTYIAIPAKRWKHIKVTPETVTTLKLENAT